MFYYFVSVTLTNYAFQYPTIPPYPNCIICRVRLYVCLISTNNFNFAQNREPPLWSPKLLA